MTKKILAVLLAVVMVVAFAACGEKKEDTKKEESGEKVLVLGGIGPITGDYANYGLSVMRGAQIAVDELNANGGVNGWKVELKFEDSQADSDNAKAAYGRLLDAGMNVSLGGTFSGETSSIVTEAIQDDIMLITPSGSADTCIEGNDKAFRVCFYDSYQGAAAANYIADNNLADKVGVFYQADLNYSIGLYDSFKAQCAVRNIEIVEVQSFTSDTNANFDAQVDKLVDSGVKLVFMPIYAADASVFLNNAKNGTADAKFADGVYFFGADGLDGILGKVTDNPSTANNVLMLTPFAADNPDAAVQAFVNTYKAAWNVEPDQFAADGYDAVYVIKAAIEKAGCTSPEDCTGTKLAAAMTQITVNGITGTMTWGADGNTVKAALAVVYQDGVGSLLQ